MVPNTAFWIFFSWNEVCGKKLNQFLLIVFCTNDLIEFFTQKAYYKKQEGQKWSKMIKNDQKWSKMIKIDFSTRYTLKNWETIFLRWYVREGTDTFWQKPKFSVAIFSSFCVRKGALWLKTHDEISSQTRHFWLVLHTHLNHHWKCFKLLFSSEYKHVGIRVNYTENSRAGSRNLVNTT